MTLILTIFCCLLISVLAFAVTLWLQVHGAGLKSWLLGPFRAWTGMNETRRPRPWRKYLRHESSQ